MTDYKNILSIAVIALGVLTFGCDVVKSDSGDIRTVHLETNKFKGSSFALNMTKYFPGKEIEETTNLSSFTITDGAEDKYLVYQDNVESFDMVLSSGSEKMIVKVKQNFIDASSCSASDNFTSATISNDEILSIDLLKENIDFCGASKYDINWGRVTNNSDGEYDKYLISIYGGSAPGDAHAILEFDPLDDYTGTIELSYTISMGIEGTPDNPNGRTWSSTHKVTITVTD